MRKNIFISLGVASLLLAGAASFALNQDLKETKAEGETVDVTLNFNSFGNPGTANTINVNFTPENDIPTGWDVAPIVQVSRDAFWLNGVPTKDDGNAVIQKQTAYNYEICIDQIRYSKYHNLIQEGDVVLVQGEWQAVYGSVTYNVTVTPINLRYTSSGWERLDVCDVYLNLDIDQGRKTNKNEFYLTPRAENPIPPDAGWGNRLKSSSNECLTVNGVASSGTSQLIKVLEYVYLIYLPDAGFAIEDNDVLKLQGIYTYSTPLLSFHVHVNTLIAQWNGTEWAIGVEEASLDDLPANSLLRNLGKYKANGASGTAIKGLDQTPETLLYRKDANGHAGYLFTQTNAASTCEFRFYLDDNDYYGEKYGQAVRSVSFDYMITNTASGTGTEGGSSLTPTGEYVNKAANAEKMYMIQLISRDRTNYYCFDVDLVADGKLHSFTLNIAFADVTGFNFKVFGFLGSFFISNLVADYDAYDAGLNNLVHDGLKMYAYNAQNGSCSTYYADAKAAYLALSEDEKATFSTNPAYASARARLAAWADANGDVLDASSGTISVKARILPFDNDGDSAAMAGIALASFAIVAAGLLIVLKKRHKRD